MRTRSLDTIRQSVFVSFVDDNHRQLEVRRLPMGRNISRFVVVDSAELANKPYQVPVLAEAKYTSATDKLSVNAPELSCGVIGLVADHILTAVNGAAMRTVSPCC